MNYKWYFTLISQSASSQAACLGTFHLPRSYEVGRYSSDFVNHNQPIIPEGINLILHYNAANKAYHFRVITLWSNYANSMKYHISVTTLLTNFPWVSWMPKSFHYIYFICIFKDNIWLYFITSVLHWYSSFFMSFKSFEKNTKESSKSIFFRMDNNLSVSISGSQSL